MSTHEGNDVYSHDLFARPSPSLSRMRSKWVVRSGLSISTIVPFLFLAVVYFDVVKHYRVMEMLGGYLVRIWILPVTVLVVLAARRILRRKTLLYGREITVGYVLLGGYLVCGVFSLLVNEGMYDVGKYGLIMFAPVTTYFIVLELFRNTRSIETAIKVLFATAIVLALYAQYSFGFGSAGGGVEFEALQTNVGVLSANEGLVVGGVRRLTLPGLEQNQFAAMLSILVLFGLYFYLNSKGWRKLIYSAGTGILVWTVLATLSRSAVIGLFMGLLVFLWYYRQSRLFLILGVAGIAYATVNSDPLIGRLANLIYQIEPYTGLPISEYLISDASQRAGQFDHFEIVGTSLLAFLEAPLVGVGVTEMLNRVFIQDHNRYLYLISTVGALTTGCYVAFILWLTSKCRLVVLSHWRRGTNPGLGVALFAACVLMIFRFLSQSNEAYYYWILFGLTAAWVRASSSVLGRTPTLGRWPNSHVGRSRP